jgi:hypothetical protein
VASAPSRFCSAIQQTQASYQLFDEFAHDFLTRSCIFHSLPGARRLRAENTNLPVNYRGATTSPLAMLATVPGAQRDANGNVSVGGGLPSQVQYSVDGSSTVNIRQNGALGNMNPSSELISEFKVTQFNRNAGKVTVADGIVIDVGFAMSGQICSRCWRHNARCRCRVCSAHSRKKK